MCKHGAFRLSYLHETIGSDNLFSVNLGSAFKVIGNKISCQMLCYQRSVVWGRSRTEGWVNLFGSRVDELVGCCHPSSLPRLCNSPHSNQHPVVWKRHFSLLTFSDAVGMWKTTKSKQTNACQVYNPILRKLIPRMKQSLITLICPLLWKNHVVLGLQITILSPLLWAMHYFCSIYTLLNWHGLSNS
jgi:hypothetical protein